MLRSMRGVTISEALVSGTSGTFRDALVSGWGSGTFRDALVSGWGSGTFRDALVSGTQGHLGSVGFWLGFRDI